ncbi:MAG TPA: DUF397 domain-containing protein [Streptosporangiaceae bacterium]|jgi:hypothetical protein|nr:DUF397 domain-containing protein [Streptosporangiaceae bacterium]
MSKKPSVQDLGIEVDAQQWRRSGDGEGSIEIAFAPGAGGAAEWVLMRVTGDPDGRILVYDRHEWECFLHGARGGEFDDGTNDGGPDGVRPGSGALPSGPAST